MIYNPTYEPNRFPSKTLYSLMPARSSDAYKFKYTDFFLIFVSLELENIPRIDRYEEKAFSFFVELKHSLWNF